MEKWIVGVLILFVGYNIGVQGAEPREEPKKVPSVDMSSLVAEHDAELIELCVNDWDSLEQEEYLALCGQ